MHHDTLKKVFWRGKKGLFPALSPNGIPYQSNGCDCGVFTSLYFWAFHSMANSLEITREWVIRFTQTQKEISESYEFTRFSQRHGVAEWRDNMREECERRKAEFQAKI